MFFDEVDIEETTLDNTIPMPPLEENEAEPAEPEQQSDQEEIKVQEYEKAPVQDRYEREQLQARNFRALKEAAERAQEERDELARKLKKYESSNKYEDFDVKEDDLVEGKHFKRAMEKIRNLEERQQEYIKQTNENISEARLRSQYPDFDKVMTLDNVRKLSDAYPELAGLLNESPDLYSKASSAYTCIKKMGIYNEKPFQAEKKKTLENMVKPRPLASVNPQKGDTPLSRVNAFNGGLTEEYASQLRREMNEASEGY